MYYILIGRFGRNAFSTSDLRGKTESKARSAGDSPPPARPIDRIRAGMNSGTGNSAETAPPFVSFGISFRAVHLGRAAACLFGLALLLGAAQALAQMSVSLMSNIDQALKSSDAKIYFRDTAAQFVTDSRTLGVRYLPETGGGGLLLSLKPHWGIATDGDAVL